MVDDLFDRGGVACGIFGLREGKHGGLEAVEDEAGATVVDGAGGEALEDLFDGDEDGAAVFEAGDVEGDEAVAALLRLLEGSAGGVVVVAELLVAEAGAAAAVTVGEDVAALVAGWFLG
ncbi:hypothetical protein GCM10011507_04080 [Edaphobacter acidisoli]|uniref:Uncharacterized protein n=1 Tax=Edaphobacter acidisoli TaxID=2040573 RepID=A0A916RHB7_9BACT|nr:hypothetical protein [Edaphobacter acidisoli]GGA55960.1 hypothetical protein GCM10011507_04080 [Edaphobacter acidisoli]